MSMSDERLEKLGIYFLYFDVKESWGITFEQFVKFVEIGLWEDMMANERLPLVHKGRLEEISV